MYILHAKLGVNIMYLLGKETTFLALCPMYMDSRYQSEIGNQVYQIKDFPQDPLAWLTLRTFLAIIIRSNPSQANMRVQRLVMTSNSFAR